MVANVQQQAETASKRVLLLFTTTGYQAGSFKQAAEALNISLVAGSDRCKNLDDPWRDGAIPLRFQEPEAAAKRIVDYDLKHPLDAIIAIGDKPTVTAALATKALGIAGNSPAAVHACRDKYQFRELLRRAGVPGPVYSRLPSDTKSPRAPSHIGFPCILKPLCLSASRGVIRADDAEQFADAFRRIHHLLQSPDIRILKDEAANWILVEKYLDGLEVALEGIIDRGILKLLALFDKPDPLQGPYFEETIYVTPSRVPANLQEQIVATTQQAIRAIGLFHGPIHAELRLTPQGPRILEIAARPIGGLCSRALRFNQTTMPEQLQTTLDPKGAGTKGELSLEELIIRHALGMPVETLQREAAASGVMMIPVPSAGILNEVKGLDAALQTADIEEIRITAKLGQKLVPWPEGSSYLGFIFARGSSPEIVETALRDAHRKINFVITPALPVLR